jgi:branched-subunit amino acid transport protein
MLLTSHFRKWLFFVGFAAIMFSIVMDSTFATDGIATVPEPSVLALVGISGAVAVLVSLLRRPRK